MLTIDSVHLFHPFIFNIFMTLYLKYISCRHHILGSFIFTQYNPLCHLIEVFRILAFYIIIDTVGFKSCYSFFICPSHLFFLVPFLLSYLLFLKNIYLFILAVLALSCSTWAYSCSMQTS